MLRKIFLSGIMVASFLLGLSGTGQATIMNLAPGILNDDNDRSLFTPYGPVVSFKSIYDRSTLDPAWSSIFGFYYASDPMNKIAIFEADDVRTLTQTSAVDFTTGTVYDVDAGWTVQSSFAVNPGIDIGFFQYYYNSDPLVLPRIKYSEAMLNTGGLKSHAAFSFKSDIKNYLLGFEEPSSNTLYSLNIVSSVTPVPEPFSAGRDSRH